MPHALRVCHVMSADLWAGAEVQVATVALYLVERPDVTLTAVLLNEGRLARELRRLGVQVTVMDEHENGAITILASLTRFLRDNRVEIVHTHRYKDNILGSIAAKLAGVPHVIRTVHGLNEAMRGLGWAKLLAYETLDKVILWCFADCIIAVSRRIAETLLEGLGSRSTAVVHIHNGIDLRKVKSTRTREDVRRSLGIDSGTLLVGAVGRLSPVKGHIHLLRAARLILQKERGARFLIVGDGPLRDELISSARQLGIDRECLFVGARADTYDLIDAMDVFVLPSLDEGVPMALLEAMALGKAVVATAVGGIPEIVTPRANGLLVEATDEQALADACLELALKPDLARTLGEHARRVVEDRFSHETNGRAVMDVYRRVLSEGKRAGLTTARELLWALGRLLRVRRTLEHVVARRRMTRIRRKPADLAATLTSARSILIVCHGNIIRSPFAARLVADALGGDASISIRSAGLEAIPGKPAHPTAVRTAAERGVDLLLHAATRVVRETVANADVIFVMDVPQLVVMRKRFPEARTKTFLMACLVPDEPLEIADPFDGDESRFQACFDQISQAVRPIIRTLTLSDQAQPVPQCVRTIMDNRSSVILLEFNELTPSLISRFIAEGRLPNFKRLYDESRVFTTDATEDAWEDKRLLNPWVQWVTVHTGVNAASARDPQAGRGREAQAPEA